jgi:hypothetical protein
MRRNLTELKFERDREQQRQRESIIAEFDASLDAMADEILLYRRALTGLAAAIDFAEVGVPFTLIEPPPEAA